MATKKGFQVGADGRRLYKDAFKLRLARQIERGATPIELAEKYDVKAGSIRTWAKNLAEFGMVTLPAGYSSPRANGSNGVIPDKPTEVTKRKGKPSVIERLEGLEGLEKRIARIETVLGIER